MHRGTGQLHLEQEGCRKSVCKKTFLFKCKNVVRYMHLSQMHGWHFFGEYRWMISTGIRKSLMARTKGRMEHDSTKMRLCQTK